MLLVGRLREDPELRPQAGTAALLELAVKRRRPGGVSEPGVTYLSVSVPWPKVRDCAEFRAGDLLAVSAFVQQDEWHDEQSAPRTRDEIIADWVERLA